MKLNLFKTVVALMLLLSTSLAHAVSCSITSTGVSTAYAPTGVVPNVTQGSFDINCFSNSGFDPATITYSVGVNNGSNAAGTQNRALLSGGNRISYETYRNSSCNVVWGSATADRFAGATSVSLPFTATINYWGCITLAGQSVAAGTYTDTVTMTLYFQTIFGIATSTTNTFPVSIINPATCTISSIANVAFGTYLAFRATPLTAPNANVVLNCTQNLPYSLSLDATSGVVSGLNYSLSLSTTSTRGTGPGQTHTISGTMPANQAGTCASGTCTASDPRVLTITY